ncbi:MAG: BsuPI-related putative proteinase inhibitor [Chthoniobacteraceae bacterium]
MRKLLPLLFLLLPSLLHAADDAPAKPGFLQRVWRSTKDGAGRAWDSTRNAGGKAVDAARSPFRKGDSSEPEAKAGWRRLAMTIGMEPAVVKAGETRVIDVTLGVVNKGKEPVQLDFPDSQRIDVLVKDEAGRILSRWSDDQRVEKEQGFVLINPGERIQYGARISTRDMKAGQSFTLEAYFPAYERLRATRKVVPVY